MSEDQKSREEFEAWCDREKLGSEDRERFTLAGIGWAHTYGNSAIEAAWRTWKFLQGSRRTYRASVLEEALEACEALRERDHDEAWQDGIGDCKDAIRALAEKTQGEQT